MGSAARGLTPYINSPEFPQKWAEMADQLHQSGAIPDDLHQKWRNNPSLLLLKSIISQTEGAEPDDVRKLRIAGIDPSSEEGKAALFPKTEGNYSPTQIGEDASGNKQFGSFNKKTGETSPFAPQQPTSNITGLQGAEFLNELKKTNPGRAGQLEGIRTGKQPLPPRGKNRDKMLDDINLIEPGFDATKWDARKALRQEFAGGKSGIGLSLQSLGQFYQHINSAYDKVDTLENNEWFPGANPALNKTKKFIRGDFQAKYNAMGTDLDAASTEMAKILRGSGTMSEKEASDWKERFDLDAAPSAQKRVLEEAHELVVARLHEIENRWNDVMGEQKGIDDLVSPQALKAFNNFDGRISARKSGKAFKPDEISKDSTSTPTDAPPIEGALKGKDKKGNPIWYIKDANGQAHQVVQ